LTVQKCRFKEEASNGEGVNTRNSAILCGAAALVVALGIIGVSMLSGVPIVSTSVNTTQPNSSQVNTAQSALPGTLTVMLTDPPHVPDGVTAVYVDYSALAVHVSGAGNRTGWTKLSSGGTIDLMSTVNFSQTIAAVKVTTGTYNALSLNVTSSAVTYNGKNYTAFVVGGYVFIPIAGGGVEVNDSKPSATIIDISPLVMNIGSQSDLEFVVRSTAVAWPVPPGQVTGQMQHEGFRFPLAGVLWWGRFSQNATANLQISSASLSANSLSVTVEDGLRGTSIKMVIVSPLAERLGMSYPEHVPMMLSGTAIFAVEANGSLVPLQQFVRTVVPLGGDESFHDIRTGLANLGYNLTAGSTATFSYTGPIGVSLPFPGMGHVKGIPIVTSSQQYLITVIGTDALASQVVVAK